jgi:LPS export ABC transporter protein LptC
MTHRWSLLFVSLAALIAGVLLYASRDAGPIPQALSPQQSLTNFRAFTLTSDGFVQSEFRGETWQKIEEDQAHVSRPVYISLDRDQVTRVTAQEALIDTRLDQAHLQGSVIITQQNQQGLTDMRTATLIYDQKHNALFTDAQVVIQSPNGEIRTTGLQAQLNEGRYQFLSDVKGYYVQP